eukprot:COSAG01_NODE_4036_length_5414_cov_56.799812_3_plen_114_part_00
MTGVLLLSDRLSSAEEIRLALSPTTATVSPTASPQERRERKEQRRREFEALLPGSDSLHTRAAATSAKHPTGTTPSPPPPRQARVMGGSTLHVRNRKEQRRQEFDALMSALDG